MHRHKGVCAVVGVMMVVAEVVVGSRENAGDVMLYIVAVVFFRGFFFRIFSYPSMFCKPSFLNRKTLYYLSSSAIINISWCRHTGRAGYWGRWVQIQQTVTIDLNPSIQHFDFVFVVTIYFFSKKNAPEMTFLTRHIVEYWSYIWQHFSVTVM